MYLLLGPALLIILFFSDESSRRHLLEKLKRGTKKKKEPDVEVPCYNTFGKPLEDCPASYENKVC